MPADTTPPPSRPTQIIHFTDEQRAELQRLHEHLRTFQPAAAGPAIANMLAAIFAFERGTSPEDHAVELASCRRAVEAAQAQRGSA